MLCESEFPSGVGSLREIQRSLHSQPPRRSKLNYFLAGAFGSIACYNPNIASAEGKVFYFYLRVFGGESAMVNVVCLRLEMSVQPCWPCYLALLPSRGGRTNPWVSGSDGSNGSWSSGEKSPVSVGIQREAKRKPLPFWGTPKGIKDHCWGPPK